MRKFLIALAAVLAPVSPLIAHPDHDMEGEENQSVEQVAKENIIKLITRGRLSAGWSKAKFQETKSRTVRGARQNVVTFRNDAEPQAARKLLFVVLTPDGDFVSAEHTLK
jgi:hypothetical protein